MRRARRGHGLLDRKSVDETFRTVRLRNIRINYELNHEWEQLCREIWVCFAERSFLNRNLCRDVLFHAKMSATFVWRSRESEPYAHLSESTESRTIVVCIKFTRATRLFRESFILDL